MIVSSLRQVPALDRPVGPCRLGPEAVDRADDVAQVADGGKAPVSGATAPTSRAVRSRRHCGAPKWRHADGTFASILHVVLNGSPGTLIVSHPGDIDDTQATQVATYVFAVSQGKAKP